MIKWIFIHRENEADPRPVEYNIEGIPNPRVIAYYFFEDSFPNRNNIKIEVNKAVLRTWENIQVFVCSSVTKFQNLQNKLNRF
jgi:hypothetical protein